MSFHDSLFSTSTTFLVKRESTVVRGITVRNVPDEDRWDVFESEPPPADQVSGMYVQRSFASFGSDRERAFQFAEKIYLKRCEEFGVSS